MAKKTKPTNGLSGKKKTVTLFLDGDKYKDPLYVGINGMNWLIQRGVPVEVPEEVAEVIQNQIRQDNKTANLVRVLSAQAQEVIG